MTLVPDGVQAAADRELDFHPTTESGKPISAWSRRAATIDALVDAVNDLTDRVAALEARPSTPFPG